MEDWAIDELDLKAEAGQGNPLGHPLGQAVGTARGAAASPRVTSGAKAVLAVWARTSRGR
jgi:hypothetical protein